jgi:superfamily II DNA or RNA helicase
MSDAYQEFIASKWTVAPSSGIATVPALSSKLKEHQRLLTSWALRRGRAAIFADTGLGKGWMILEWSRVVAQHTGKPVLILAPLAVSQQFAREAEKLGTGLTVCSSQADVRPGVNVTNYQKLHRFDASSFGGVAADESSIMKHLNGHYRGELIESFRATPFRLSATATPSPNDFTELGGQAEFLGICTHQEMLSTFFVHDGSSTQDWRLKGHAREAFWRWVCSWGAIVKLPSDLGCDDAGYILPPLRYHEHVIPASEDETRASGLLFAAPAATLNEQRAARRGSLSGRVAKSVELANAADGQVIVWCDLNVESDALSRAIDGAVEVIGSQDDDEKEAAIDAFLTGKARVIVSKTSLMGFGLNVQCANTQVFCGVSHSFEAFFQGVRRSWRFGQEKPVDVHIVSSELEGRVVENLKEKQRKADELSQETRRHVAAYIRTAVSASGRDVVRYNPTKKFRWPSWMQTEES